MPDSAPGTVRRALLIGIDTYVLKPLDGCVADAELMATVLRERFAFDEQNITLLRNRDASRTAVLAAFDQLVAATQSGDTALFYYAGHGSLGATDDGTEASGSDSTLNVWEDPREDVYDDEIHARLQALGERTPHTVMIIDACHSGTIARDADASAPKERWNVPVSRAQRPVLDLGPHAVASRATDSYVLISACRDDEIAKESAKTGDDGSAHGALTFALAQALLQAKNGATWRDVFEPVARGITRQYADQHPQIEGNADRELFGLREFTPLEYVTVTDRARARVTLAAGALHGVSNGDSYTVFAADTKDPATAAPLGRVEVLQTHGTSSESRIVAEVTPGTIVTGTRAFPAQRTTVERALALANTNPKSRLRGTMTLDIWRMQPDGTWSVAESDAAAGMPVFASGERIAFSITSTLDTPVFVNLFDFDAQGSVSAFTKGNANMLAPNRTFEIGKADGRKIALTRDGDDAVESFKLFASISAVDLSYLTRLDPLARATENPEPISAEDWTAVTRQVLLRRASLPGT